MTTNWKTRGIAVLTLAALMMLAACSSSEPEALSASSAPSSDLPSANPTTTQQFDYSTRFFDPPLDIDLPPFIDETSGDEGAAFVTWGSPDGSVAVRVLRPVVVYTPDATTTSPPPAEFVEYVLGLEDHGAHFADRVDTKVDGRDAAVVTATTDQPIDGALGCPETGMAAADCFGPQPEFSLRLAVITTDTGPLLIWLRSNADAAADLAAAAERLDSFLSGVRFATRSEETESASAALDTEYDGTYTWEITEEDAVTYGLPSDKTEEGLALYPATFTVTLSNGQATLHETSEGGIETTEYLASPGRLVIGPTGSGLTADVTRDPDGTLHLTAVPPILDAGGVFILTTKPWTPVK